MPPSLDCATWTPGTPSTLAASASAWCCAARGIRQRRLEPSQPVGSSRHVTRHHLYTLNLCRTAGGVLQHILYDEEDRAALEQLQSPSPAAEAGLHQANLVSPETKFGKPLLRAGEPLKVFIHDNVNVLDKAGTRYTTFAIVVARAFPPARQWVVYR